MFAGYRYRNRLGNLIDDWIRYRTIVGARLGAEDVTSDEEHRFLQLKGRIVENLAAISPQRSSGAPHQEMQGRHTGMSDFLSRRASLAAGEPFTDREREEFEREWHQFFLYLNRLKGMPPPTAQKKPSVAPLKSVSPRPTGAPGMAGLGWIFRFVLRLALIVAGIWVLVTILPWERISGGRLRSAVPDSWDSARNALAGLRFPTLGGIFDPVVDRYGPEVTSIMLAVLLVALGYWLFVRMK